MHNIGTRPELGHYSSVSEAPVHLAESWIEISCLNY